MCMEVYVFWTLHTLFILRALMLANLNHFESSPLLCWVCRVVVAVLHPISVSHTTHFVYPPPISTTPSSAMHNPL